MSGLTQCNNARRNCVGMQTLQTVRLWMLHASRSPHYFRPHAPASAPPPAQPSYCSDLPMTLQCWVLSVTVMCRRGTSPCISECKPSINHTPRKRWVKYAVDSKLDWTVKSSNNSTFVPLNLNKLTDVSLHSPCNTLCPFRHLVISTLRAFMLVDAIWATQKADSGLWVYPWHLHTQWQLSVILQLPT